MAKTQSVNAENYSVIIYRRKTGARIIHIDTLTHEQAEAFASLAKSFNWFCLKEKKGGAR